MAGDEEIRALPLCSLVRARVLGGVPHAPSAGRQFEHLFGIAVSDLFFIGRTDRGGLQRRRRARKLTAGFGGHCVHCVSVAGETYQSVTPGTGYFHADGDPVD